MKNICFFNTYPTWGGGVKFYIGHALGLQDLGYQVTAVCRSLSDLSLTYANAEISQLNMSVSNRSVLNPFKLAKLVQFYKREKIDIVVFTTSGDLKLGSIAAKIAGVKTIVYRRGLAVPIKNRFTNRYLFKNVVTHLMANSEETKRTILKYLSEIIEPDRIKVIYNSLDTNRPIKQESSVISSNGSGFIIGNAGRLVEQKGQKHLIEIAKALKKLGVEFTLLIAGDGPLEAELAELIRLSGLQQDVKILGYIDDMAGFMASIDVFAMTSRWEGFGYVLVEAMLATKPIVAFDTSSTPEIVIHEQTGYLVGYPDTSTFANKLAELSQDVALRLEMGQKGRQSAKDRFEIKSQILKFVDFINS